MIKILKTFFGGYTPNHGKLRELGYLVINMPSPLIIATNQNHGYGEINGSTKKMGEKYTSVPVCVFSRSSRQLIWETQSKPDGTYAFRNVATGLECFVIAFDPNNQYNAVIQDKVVAK